MKSYQSIHHSRPAVSHQEAGKTDLLGRKLFAIDRILALLRVYSSKLNSKVDDVLMAACVSDLLWMER